MEGPYILLAGMLAGSGGVIAYLFKLMLTAKDDAKTELLKAKEEKYELLLTTKAEQLKAAQGVADEAMKSAKDTTDFYRNKEGKPPLLMVAPVVAEGSSPPTIEQHFTAWLATKRAQMALIKLYENQEPRTEPGNDG